MDRKEKTKKQANDAVPAWAGASSSELRIARELARQISSTKDKKVQGRELLELTQELLNNDGDRFKDTTFCLGKAWPASNKELTSNLISQIAYEVERRDTDVKTSGSYFTPRVLAVDMVRIAAQKWMETNSRKIKEAMWYDPCVGGGIFPVAIMDYLLKNGVAAGEVHTRIVGTDINPLFVEATKIRLALVLSKANPRQFLSMYRKLTGIIVGDSLRSFPEEGGIFSINMPVADIVIGNPPYVRSNSLLADTKEMLKDFYPSVWTGTTDLYMFFIAHGLNALKNAGLLCYVSPATFLRTSSGSLIRKYILENADVDTVYDFDELPVFENVSSHISVYVLSKGKKDNSKTNYVLFSELPYTSPLLSCSVNSQVHLTKNRAAAWSFNPDNNSIMSFLERGTVPLRSLMTIYSGIKTGLKQAYELNAQEHADILEDVKSKDYISPLLKPRQIDRWSHHWKDTYQIVIPRGQKIDAESKAYEHLLSFKDDLERRTDLREGDPWYSLRDCAYLDLFAVPKIVYRDISAFPRFAMDTEGMTVVDGAFFIPNEDYFLLGLLNSRIGAYYFKSKCATIGSDESRARLRFKKVYVSEFPVPKNVSAEAKTAIETLVRGIVSSDTMTTTALEEELDDRVFDLYGVPNEYKKSF